MVQGFGQLGLREGGNGEPLEWSGLILIHLYVQERLKEELFESDAWLSKLDWAKQSCLRD